MDRLHSKQLFLSVVDKSFPNLEKEDLLHAYIHEMFHDNPNDLALNL